MTLGYSDFDYFLNGNIQALNVGNALVISRTGSGSPGCNFAPKNPPNAQGVTVGRLTSDANLANSSSSQSMGLVCMQSARNITTSGTAYALRFHKVAGVFTLELLKLSNGLPTFGVLATLGVSSSLIGLQLAWAVNADFDGIVLQAGYYTTPGVIIPALSYMDHQPYLSTTVTEGGYYNDGGSGASFTATFDNLTLEGP